MMQCRKNFYIFAVYNKFTFDLQKLYTMEKLSKKKERRNTKSDADEKLVRDVLKDVNSNLGKFTTILKEEIDLVKTTICSRHAKPTMNAERASQEGFSSLIIRQEIGEKVMRFLHEYIDNQTKPRCIVMPIKAAMEVGVISRPSWTQFVQEFGKNKIRSKSSLTDYLNENYVYQGEDYKKLIYIFQQIDKQ